MRLEQFEYVIAVADAGSMNRAADVLHVSQQNISKAIGQLEREMQVTIFYRSKKGVLLTADGEKIYQFAFKQIEDYKALQKRLYEIQCNHLSGTISICTMNCGTSMIIPQMLCYFYKKYPNVKLNISDGTAKDVIQQVKEEKADVGFITYQVLNGAIYPELSNLLEVVPLLSGRLHFWVRKESSYAKQGFITLQGASQESILVDNIIDLEMLKPRFAIEGLELKINHQANNLQLLSQLIINGQGIFPDMLLSTKELLYSYVFEKKDLIAVPVYSEVNEYSAIGYVVHKNQKRDTLMSHMRKYLESIKKSGGNICD